MGFSTGVSLSVPRGRHFRLGIFLTSVGLFATFMVIFSQQDPMTYDSDTIDKVIKQAESELTRQTTRTIETKRNSGGEKLRTSSEGQNVNKRKLKPQFDPRIKLPGSFSLFQSPEGCMFYPGGADNCFKTSINVTLLKFLSPEIENLAIRHFLGIPGDNLMYANSPAFYQEDDGNFTIVARMWQEAEAYASLNKRKPPINVYQDNLLFTLRVNNKFEPLDRGHFIGIPSPARNQIGAGPIEPRLFRVRDRLLVSYNTGYRPGESSFLDYTFIWDYRRQYVMTPQIKDGGSVVFQMRTDQGYQRRDKHWMALNDGRQLYMIQTLEPLRVLKCNVSDEFNCEYMGPRIPLEGVGSVRGGTPFVMYKWPYYISAVHSTMHRQYTANSYKRYYVFHLLVMSVYPAFKIEYMTEAIQIHQQVLKSCPIVRNLYIKDDFFFPVSIHLETIDSLVVGGHINDHSAAVFRITGIRKMMAEVMKPTGRVPEPPSSNQRTVLQHAVGSLNDFAIRTSSRATGYKISKADY